MKTKKNLNLVANHIQNFRYICRMIKQQYNSKRLNQHDILKSNGNTKFSFKPMRLKKSQVYEFWVVPSFGPLFPK